jgi:hypothetical protein
LYLDKPIAVHNVENYYTYTNQDNYEVYFSENFISVFIGTFDEIGRHHPSTIEMNIRIQQGCICQLVSTNTWQEISIFGSW